MTKNIYKNIEKNIFSNKYNHVYLYGQIDNESVLNVRLIIDDFNKTKDNYGIKIEPKKIILHINSPGGYLTSGISLMNIIRKSRVPIIVLVEGLAASAATLITVAAKYRIMCPYSFLLIHQLSGGTYGKYEQLKHEQKISDKAMREIKQIFIEHTNIPNDLLNKLLMHDIYLSPSECLKFNLIDIVLNPISKKELNSIYHKYPIFNLPTNIFNIKTNFNNIYLYGSFGNKSMTWQEPFGVILTIHNILSMSNLSNNNYYGVPKPIILNISDLGQFRNLFEILPIINTIILSYIPIYSIIDGPASIYTLLFTIVCRKRFIFKHSYIDIDLVGFSNFQEKHEDIIFNVEIFRKTIIKLLKKYTKIPNTIIKKLFTERFLFTSKQCVEYKICDEILY